MSLWSWYRRRGIPWKIAIGLGVSLAVAALLYTGIRALQYTSAENNAGIFAPSSADLLIRARDLEGHLERIKGTHGWRSLRHRILKDRALRRSLNAALKDAGLPTLDDLEDVRKARLYSEETLLRAVGRDALLAVRLDDDRTRWCVATHLRFGDFLLAPFARWVLETQTVSGRTFLKWGDFWAASSGALAVAGNDPELLADALRARGVRETPEPPLEGRLSFERSSGLKEFFKAAGESGLLPVAKLDAARALDFSVDLQGSAIRFEAVLEGAEAGPPGPASFARRAPEGASGYLVLDAELRDLHTWLTAPSKEAASVVSKDIRVALEALDQAGFSDRFLPKVGSGVVLLLGIDEESGDVAPGVALVVPSRDPSGAVEAFTAVIEDRKIAGSQGRARRESLPVGAIEMISWRWPAGILLGPVPLNDVLRPCAAALPDAVVLGNNVSFTEAVIEAAMGMRGTLEEESRVRRARRKLREYGMGDDPPCAEVLLFPPKIRESTGALVRIVAAHHVEATTNLAELRRRVVAEHAARGRRLSDAEIGVRFNEALERLKLDKEDSLREVLLVLDRIGWVALSVRRDPQGAALRAFVELK